MNEYDYVYRLIGNEWVIYQVYNSGEVDESISEEIARDRSHVEARRKADEHFAKEEERSRSRHSERLDELSRQQRIFYSQALFEAALRVYGRPMANEHHGNDTYRLPDAAE